ncbi:MAG TPA: PfkB family carbohydrate kinase, partial [Nitrospira sp.]|nr:PfkB family carbohydrate kinase [Nitrospira sp.]
LTTILNPAPAAPLPSDLLRLVDILTPNESEAQVLTGSTDPAEAAQILTGRGVGTVVVTCGANGAFLTTGNDVTHIPGFLVVTIDSTGAGDAFNGALACAVAEGVPLKSAIERANAAGALATTGRGAQESMPTKDDIEQLCRSGVRQMEPRQRS